MGGGHTQEGSGGHFFGSSSKVATLKALWSIMSYPRDGNVDVSGTTTLTIDMFYDTLTVSTGTLIARGVRVYGRICTVAATGVVHADGADAAAGVGGAAFTGVSIGANIAGTNGGTGAGVNNTTASGGLMVSTAAIGNKYRGGGGGAGSGGAGGTSTGARTVSTRGGQLSLPTWVTAQIEGAGAFVAVTAGCGGAGGGGDGAAASGGGGGAGGGFLYMYFHTVINNGIIRAKGGAGANGTANNCGGGGGGGGGCVLIICVVFAGITPLASGGAKGLSGGGAGVDGTAGDDGEVFVQKAA